MTWTIEFSLQWSLRTWTFCLFEKLTFLNLLCFFQICFCSHLYACVFSLRVCLCITLMPGVCAGQNKGSDLLELELDSCERQSRYWEWKPGPTAEQPLRLLLQPWRFVSILFYVHGHFVCMYTCATHARSTSGSQKKVLDPPELEWQMVVTHLCFLCLKPYCLLWNANTLDTKYNIQIDKARLSW